MQVDGDNLREWLLDAAGVHERFVDKVTVALEVEEVVDVGDLRVLAGLPQLDICGISALNVAKIRAALSKMAGDGARSSPKAAAGQVRSPATVEMVTPPGRRTRAPRLQGTARKLFTEAALDSATAATRLQAAARRRLAMAGAVHTLAAVVRLQAAMRRTLAAWLASDMRRVRDAPSKRLEEERREVEYAAGLVEYYGPMGISAERGRWLDRVFERYRLSSELKSMGWVVMKFMGWL